MRRESGEKRELLAILGEISAILNNTPVALLLVDSERKVRRVNQAVVDLAGKPEDQMIGVRGGEALGCIHALDDPAGCGNGPHCETCKVKDAVIRSLETGQRYHNIETRMTFGNDDDRQEKDILVSTALIEGLDEPLVLVCVEDITERNRLADRLERSRRLELLGSLASGVAHEVRNPLNSILAISDALNEDLKDKPEYGEYLEQIRLQVDRLNRLMQDLLDLGKPLQMSSAEPLPVRDLCMSALDLWRQSPASARVSVSIEGGDGLEVTGDGARLQQVLLNLIENAVEHSPDGSPVTVMIDVSGGGTARIRVADRGTGIPEETLPRVFEPFFTTRRKGTGLGLSIVRHIIESHGGGVSIRNNDPPPGCTVEIVLPGRKDIEV